MPAYKKVYISPVHSVSHHISDDLNTAKAANADPQVPQLPGVPDLSQFLRIFTSNLPIISNNTGLGGILSTGG